MTTPKGFRARDAPPLSKAVCRVTVACGLALIFTACGSTAVTSLTPTGVKCGVSLSSPSGSLPGQGGNGDIAVATQPECGWTASTSAAWITGLTPREGQGAAVIRFDASPNTGGQPRRADVIVNDVTVTIHQAPCGFEVSPPDLVLAAPGGTRTLQVTGERGCVWSATTDALWITIPDGASGSGDGAVTLVVARNTGKSRAATVIVAGRSITILQFAPALGLLARSDSDGHPSVIMILASTGPPAWWVPVTAYAPAAGT